MLHKFQRDHGTIMAKIGSLEAMGLTNDAGRAHLEALEGEILNHLREEEEVLYPMLWELARQDKKLRRELERLHAALEGFSMAAAEFFLRLEAHPEAEELEEAFRSFKEGLLRRVAWEEQVIPKLMAQRAVSPA